MTLLREACDAGNHDGCAGLAIAEMSGQGIARDVAGGNARAQRSCDSGSSYGCVVFANHLLDSEDDSEVKRGVELLGKACDARELDGCEMLASVYSAGHGVAKDAPKALELLRRACSDGHGQSCVRLAMKYQYGDDGLEKNAQTASQFYTKG